MTKTSKITYTAIFAAIATVLMYFEFPIPFMPPFLKVDLSGAVVLIGAFIFGIAPAITMIGIKDIIHLTQTQTGGSGEVADFARCYCRAAVPRSQEPQDGCPRLCSWLGCYGVCRHVDQLFSYHSVLFAGYAAAGYL